MFLIMYKYELIDNLTSNLSITLKLSYKVNHDVNWLEHRTKTEYTIWTIITGNVWIIINNKEFLAKSGDIILFYPGDTYTAHTNENGCSFIYNRFRLEMGSTIDIMSTINMSGIIPGCYIKEYADKFCERFLSMYTSPQHISLELYSEFLYYLSKVLIVGKRYGIFFYTESNCNRKIPMIDTILHYINGHFTEHISVKQLSKMSNLSEKYFIASFTSLLGISPKQYIIECRMKLASELLCDPNTKIGAVAAIVGYSDQYSFSKAFKKYFEESPTEFQKQFIY